MHLDDLSGRDVTLLGVGLETLAVIPVLREAGVAAIEIVEAGPLSDERRAQLIAAGFAPDDLASTVPGNGDVVLRSPGFPRHRPEVERLAALCAVMTTPTGLWLALRGPERTVVVTGTKGKSSTATLIHDGLVAAGVACEVVGNIGRSAWDLDPSTDAVVVAELSSYQGADLIGSGEVAVLTMLSADHLDWHGSPEVYQRDKLRILGLAAGVEAPRSDDDAFVVPPAVSPRLFALADQWLPSQLREVVTRVEATGDHRSRNVALAVAAVEAELALRGVATVDPTVLNSTLAAGYPHLEGRFAAVDEVSGVRYVDDALASNPTATAAGLEALRPGPAVLICGGHDRSVSLAPVVEELTNWPPRSLVVAWLGDDDDHRRVVLADQPAVAYTVSVPSMDDAVIVASLAAGPGSTVLFSPLAPTEPSEGTWKDRSAAFKTAVAALPRM